MSDAHVYDEAEIESLGDADLALADDNAADSRVIEQGRGREPEARAARLNGPAGADKLLAFATYPPGMCLEAVSKALGSYSLTSDKPGYYTYALRVYERTPKSRLRSDKRPPKGAVVFFSASNNGYGHICLSYGGGKIVSTDIPQNGTIGVTTIDALASKWGRRYLGWTDWMMGHDVLLEAAPVPAPNPKPVPKPTPASKSKLHGVDVSSWQHQRVLRDIDEYDFAIVKATGGPSFVSNTHTQQVADAVAKGRRVGLYHFALDGFDNEGARAEADHFAATVRPHLRHNPVLVLDWEADATQLPVSWAADFIKRVREKTGKTCVFYSYANYVQTKDLSSIVDLGSWLWIAAYGDGSRRHFGAAPGRPKSGSWPKANMFQFTATGRLNGHAGDLDLNVFYGSAADWDAYAGGKPAPAPKPPQPKDPKVKPEDATSASGASYTVRSGDTLTAIAKKHGTTVAAIQAVNPIIKHPDRIDVGWVLKLPKGNAAVTYEVRSGDTLSGIAAAHSTTVKAIVALNGIANPDLIYVGQKLRIQ
ncbi:LysM peptidoglycan-binding domain-containing protein [Gulosibacter molinativorax]|uniref:LysM peptidoglycan-binding domain-containing protein n=1 Tax=Gulosibacter molinativorax TaxID=256821 RepID=A0ABT7C497_9MICO|nr:LysM peptidoglycan-binding domain-containing protein [Gulosibacter molinativorax]MDJ1369973.1 LysM peptidoglycan-binding domain-containing protein [Gulosibacter molinativorax]QUY63837.1 Membrane-bound lytic murein transglycosylase D [Gulosibacter molinativorax]